MRQHECLSGAGKTTICKFVEKELRIQGYKVEVLDGDAVRQNLCKGLGFSKKDREENIRRIGFVAHLLARNNVIVLVSTSCLDIGCGQRNKFFGIERFKQ